MTAQAGGTSLLNGAKPPRDSADVDRASVRKEVRRLRRALDAQQRSTGERSLYRRIVSLGAYRQARAISIYYAFDGEPSVARVVDTALRQGKRVYAPVVVGERLRFAPVETGAAMRRNVFGIAEPAVEQSIDPRHLDLVLTPLVAFDERGVRLGVGRGYYDRAFRFLSHRKFWTRPKLLGVAWSFQQVKALTKQPWDIPLWGAVTEAATHRFANVTFEEQD